MLCRSHDYYLYDIYEESEIGEGFENIEPLRGNSTQRSFEVRDKYRHYFLSFNGAVPWHRRVSRILFWEGLMHIYKHSNTVKQKNNI